MSLENQFNLEKFSEEWKDHDADTKRKDLVFMARTAEASERYSDMCKCMRQLVIDNSKEKTQLSVDERNLLSVAYKNVIGCRRASWRTLNAEVQDEKNGNLIAEYKKIVEGELKEICNDVLHILTQILIKDEIIKECNDVEGRTKEVIQKEDNEAAKKKETTNTLGEAQVFYLKMAGDYYRYLAEAVSTVSNEKQAAEYYKKAFELSQKVLEPTHPIRLGLALNYSVCFYEILKDKKKACQLAKDAFDEAISKLDKLEEADYKDSTLIMQLLRDNLTLWTSTDNDNEEDNAIVDNNDDGGD